jgi:PAS domain S-box-containing protein
MTEAIFIVDAEGRLTDFNDTFITYHRFKDQEECSKTITECPDYLEAFFEDGTPAPPKQWAMLRALRGETCSYTEYRLRRKDTGETWWGSYTFGPIKDKEGRIVGAVVTARDITERKQVEQRLAVNVAALTRMHELSSRAVEAKGLQTLLQEAMDTAVSIVSAAKGTLQLFEGGTLRLVAHQGHKRPFLKFFAAAETVASLCGEATRRGERVVVEDVEQSPLFAGTPSLPMLRAAGVRAAQSTPLLTRGGRLLGILTTQWATPHRPDEHDLWRLDLLVRQVADLIEQRQAEEALLREKELYRTLARNLPGLVYRVHLDGHRRMEFFNQSLVAMTGYTEAELTTGEVCSIEPLIVAEDRAVVVAAIHQAIRKHQPFEVEYRLRTKAGELRHFAERGQPVYGADGRCTQLDGLIFDTTTHKEAAARLQESQAQLSQLTENIREVFWLGTPDWNEVLYISPGYKELWGRSRESMYRSPRSWMKAIVAQDRPAVRAAVEAGIAGKLPVHFPPYRVKRPDGTVHWVEARAWPVRDEAGRVYRIAGIIDDITERKRAEEALRASEQRLALATSGARIGMFEWDVATGKVLWTEQQARLLGLATTTTTTTTTTMTTTLSLPYRYRDWARRVHREDLARVEAEQRRCMTKHLPYECEYRVVWPDKSVHWLVGRGVWLYDAKGRPERMLGVTMDITGRKQVEALLRELNVGLEQRVMERTAELSDAHDRLRAIMDNALVGILTLDERGLIVTINPAVTAIFGYAPEELVGSRGNRLWASPIQAADEEFPAHYTQPGDPQLMGAGREVLGRRKDGEVIAVELTISEFRHRDRRQFVAMVRDISARKRLEAELLEVSERERQRLGHDLHDGLGQHLHALYYLASLLEKDMKGSAPKRAREVGRLSRQLEHALTLTRGLARGLQPVNAEPEGLMIALRELAERTRALYRVDCRFLCRAPVLIHRHSAANHLYRIAQEAVNNAMKHGKPTQVRIELTGTPQRVLLGVRDNGVGIRRRSTPAKGMGLRVMQYRADAISGSLTTQRLPEGGTAVVCSVARQALLPQNATTDH